MVNRSAPSNPWSDSAAPPPRFTERILLAMSRTVSNRSFDSVDEMNVFLESEEGRRAIESSQPKAPWERAQDLAYDAWEAEGPERYALAEQALKADPRCSDAWLVLAELERSWRKQKRGFERAVAAAEKTYEEEGWRDAAAEYGSLYHLLPARSYLRALMALARHLFDGGYPAEAQRLYGRMLDLDPEDHMGVRYELVRVYHRAGDREGLRDVLDRFPDDDGTTLAYERLWLAVAEGQDEVTVNGLQKQAIEANPHVISVFRDEDGEPDSEEEDSGLPSGYVTVGGKDEAVAYLAMAMHWWLDEPRTLEWVRQQRGE